MGILRGDGWRIDSGAVVHNGGLYVVDAAGGQWHFIGGGPDNPEDLFVTVMRVAGPENKIIQSWGFPASVKINIDEGTLQWYFDIDWGVPAPVAGARMAQCERVDISGGIEAAQVMIKWREGRLVEHSELYRAACRRDGKAT